MSDVEVGKNSHSNFSYWLINVLFVCWYGNFLQYQLKVLRTSCGRVELCAGFNCVVMTIIAVHNSTSRQREGERNVTYLSSPIPTSPHFNVIVRYFSSHLCVIIYLINIVSTCLLILLLVDIVIRVRLLYFYIIHMHTFFYKKLVRKKRNSAFWRIQCCHSWTSNRSQCFLLKNTCVSISLIMYTWLKVCENCFMF